MFLKDFFRLNILFFRCQKYFLEKPKIVDKSHNKKVVRVMNTKLICYAILGEKQILTKWNQVPVFSD